MKTSPKESLIYSKRNSFLEAATKLNKETPDGSVLKYAVKAISQNLMDYAIPKILDTTIGLAWHFPIILPHLERLLSHEDLDANEYCERINNIIIENAKNFRSDGMAWCIYYLWKFDLGITEDAFISVLNSKDCIAILLLHLKSPLDDRVIIFAKEILKGSDYLKDQYWLLLYHLFLNGSLKKVYKNDFVFKTMKKYKVNFLPQENQFSIGEEYCDYMNNPFDDSKRELFENWLVKRKSHKNVNP